MSAATNSQESSMDGKVVYEVKQVFIHIPAEQSATRFELKISGSAKVMTKGLDDVAFLLWDPEELTYQDIYSLYSNETEEWTLVEEHEADSAIVINKQPQLQSKPDVLYSPEDGLRPAAVKREPKIDIGRNEAKYTPQLAPPPNTSPVEFTLSQLKYIKENTGKGLSTHGLTFFLTDGRELPTLHFHDGGTSGLLQSLKRYLYFVRDGKDSRYLRVEESPFIVKPSDQVSTDHGHTTAGRKGEFSNDVVKGVEGLISSAVLEVGKRVRHGFKNSRDMLEERPRVGSPPEEEIETITCHDIKKGGGKGLTPDPDMSLITDFQVVSDLSRQLPSRPYKVPRLPPLGREEWESYRQIDGRITPDNEKLFRARVFAGGIDPCMRREVWKYLLGYFKFDATDIERMETQKVRADQYEVMKRQWKSFLPEQEQHWQKWRDHKQLVDKDVIRTDRELDMYHSLTSPSLVQLQDILNTYTMYNFDLGYVQGMSDLLAPLLAVMENECDAFWCFVGLMKMVGRYFEETQTEMRLRIRRLRALLSVLDPSYYQFLKDKDSGNLYFAFRWLLIDFKREFSYDDLMSVWEVIWTHHLSIDYALFIALAIIDQERDKLKNENFDFSDIIAHVNDLAKKLEYVPILLEAESICRQIAAVQNLPEELELLINNPLPEPHNFITNK